METKLQNELSESLKEIGKAHKKPFPENENCEQDKLVTKNVDTLCDDFTVPTLQDDPTNMRKTSKTSKDDDDDDIASLNELEIEEGITAASNNHSHDIETNDDDMKIGKFRKKHIAIMDSDSEEEMVSTSLAEDISVPIISEQAENQPTVSPNEVGTKDSEINNTCIIIKQSENTLSGSDNFKVDKMKRKRIAIVDSESEDELGSSPSVNDISPPSDDEQLNQNKFIDTDSEDDSSTVFPNVDVESFNKNKKKHKLIVDSDSDYDDITTHNKSFADETENDTAPIYTTDYKGKLIVENPKTKKSLWTDLCDSESSDDEVNQEPENPTDNGNVPFLEEEILEPTPYKKKHKPKGGDSEKKMTSKEAAKLRKEIQSESQRMVREMDVSLPYHRPKQFTLKEFLSRRPKLASTVPTASKMPPSIAMKMSRDQLKDILKKLEERKKEVQEFYKSESEPEDNDDDKDDTDYVPPNDTTYENVSHNENTVPDLVDDASEATSKPTQDTEMEEKVEDSGIDSQEIVEDSPIDHGESENNQEKSKEKEYKEVGSTDTINIEEKEFEQEEIISECRDEKNGVNLENQHSMEYEFNLDDVEENSERILNSIENIDQTEKLQETETEILEESPNKTEERHQPDENQCFEELTNINNPLNSKKPFDYSELDEEIENFGNTEDIKVVEKPNLSKLELIKERLANIKPRLSGDPDHVIDLDTSITRPNQVRELMERFLQHNTKHHHKHRVKVNVVSVESGQIHKETLAMNVDDEDDSTEKEAKPGAMLMKLKSELQDQIKQHRSEIWKKKAVSNDIQEKDPYKGEKSECGGDDDGILDEDEEEEMSESSEEEEEEDEGNEEQSTEKKKLAFIDDEAEESDREVEFDDEENDIKDKGENEEEIEEEGDEDSSSSNVAENLEEVPVNKTLKRIVKGFTEDSDDEEDTSNSQNNVTNAIENLNKSLTEETTQDDDYIPPYQLQNTKTPLKQVPLATTKSDFDFLTPISYITGLQNLNSASKPKNSVKSPFQMPNVPSPLKDSNWQSNLQKKLFSHSEITSSQAEAIAEMCSSKFSDSQETTDSISNDHPPDSQNDIPPTAPPNTQDLLNVCSGDFAETSEPQIPASMPPTSQDLLDICSGDFAGTSRVVAHEFRPAHEEKELGAEEDLIISQLLDEEEMASFRRKFDSPALSATQRRVVEEFEGTGGGGVIGSDDEDEGLEVRKRRNQMKLTFSDDDSSDDDQNQDDDEEIDLHDEIDEDDEDVPADNIGYDSEENEVEYVDDEDQTQERPKPLKTADFFEDEAELSESEWGSADEDEKDLDDLEFELGDTDKFDEKQMRTDLERIHMRRMLDDDTREVKLLQELLLEDGELHGSGRQRQFKWKNLDSMNDDDEESKKEEDDAYLDEDESEEQWRRKRFEREMFLKEKQSKSQAVAEVEDDDEDVLEESQFLKIGHKVMGRSQSSSQSNVSVEKTVGTAGSPDIKSAFSLTNKRGSFLSRNDQVLQRLAEYNKQTTNIALGTATAKNSRNFLFQTVSVMKTTEIEVKKRKTTDDTPRAIKKLRLSDNLSPAVKKKPERLGAKAKLFGNH